MTTPAGQPPNSLKTSIDLARLATKDNAVLAVAAMIAADHFGLLSTIMSVC